MPPLFGNDIKTGPDILEFMKDVAKADLYGITCLGKSDGGGAQIIAAMSVQLFCELTGHTYYHSPLRRVRFAMGDKEWDAKWEAFFNLGHEEKTPPADIPVLSVAEYLDQGRPSGVILAMPYCHNYIENVHSADAYAQMRDRFRAKYRAADKSELDAKITHKDYLALHIRRGDVSSDENSGRYTGPEAIIDTVRKFSEEVGFSGEIHVFSQGEEADFAFLDVFDNVKFFINTDIFETMHRIANAKAIVAAKSAVSLVAGMISEAPMITEVWYHRPLDRWYTMSALDLPVQYGVMRQIKGLELKAAELLAVRTDEANQEILDLTEQNEAAFLNSSKLMWARAQVLLRNQDDDAYKILETLLQTNTPQANAAKKTMAAHIKMGIYYREQPLD